MSDKIQYYPIDKKTYKAMKYLYRMKDRDEEVDIHTFDQKFEDRRGDHMSVYLIGSPYAHIRINGKLTNDTSCISSEDKIILSMQGIEYVENRKSNTMRWVVPVIISLAALLCSIASLCNSFSSNPQDSCQYNTQNNTINYQQSNNN